MASAQGAATFSVVAKDAASSVLRSVGKQMGSLGKTGSAVFKTLAVAAAAVGAALTAAAAASLKLARSAISAAIADDAEQQKLIATLKARGLSTEQATKRIDKLIAAGEKLAFTDSEIRKSYEISSSFAKKYANQQKILSTAQDLARAKNISLEAATKLVGRAFDGSTGALSRYGIQIQKGVKGLGALGAINKKVGGVAEQYANTFAGQFSQIRIAIDETVESIGYAIGGGEGLPTFTRLLEGIRPVLDDVLGEIKANLPAIQRFSRELVEKFLARLPGYVATAKRELPILIDKAKEFIGSVAGFGKDLSSFLGPEGLVTAGIAGLGFKMGGLGGALGATFASEFIKLGVDPITASITGTLAGAITAGVVQGFASSAAQAAVSKFLGLFKTVPISPTIPTTIPGAGIGTGVAGAGLAAAGVAVSIVAITTAAAAALTNAITTKGLTNKVGGNNVIDIFGTTAATLKPSTDPLKDLKNFFQFVLTGTRDKTESGVKSGVVEGFKAVPMQPPIDLTNRLELKLDGRVVASSVSKYLGLTTNSTNAIRNTGRNQ